MFNRQLAKIHAAIAGSDKVDPAALSEALCNPTQELEHHGPLKVYMSIPQVDRGFGSADGLYKPEPPVQEPVVTQAALTVENIADGEKDGSNGFAADFKGIVRTSELWSMKWATVASLGTVGDYFYTDGYECGNGHGGAVGAAPIRVFYQTAGSRPAVGSIIGYIRDRNGLACGISQASGSMSDGAAANDILYWNGSAWVILTGPSATGRFYLVSISGTLTWVAAATQTVVTDIELTGLNLQRKTRSVYIDPAAAESALATVTNWTGTECA